MHTKTIAFALHAKMTLFPVLADAGAKAFLAFVPLSDVLTDTGAKARLA